MKKTIKKKIAVRRARRLSVLFAGEQVSAIGHEIKGFDSFEASANKEDGVALFEALKSGGHDVVWMRTNQVAVEFPERLADLRKFDVVILSDVGANTLLFHPEMLAKSIPHPNRLKLIRDYVRAGGGLIMVGGWMSFSGIGGKAKYYGTPVEETLPVNCLTYDDREERPEGVTPTILAAGHPILNSLPAKWPYFLGYNRVLPKPDATVVLAFESDPLLSVWSYGKGRSAAFSTDCAPHWGPAAWLAWPGYRPFWGNLVSWIGST